MSGGTNINSSLNDGASTLSENDESIRAVQPLITNEVQPNEKEKLTELRVVLTPCNVPVVDNINSESVRKKSKDEKMDPITKTVKKSSNAKPDITRLNILEGSKKVASSALISSKSVTNVNSRSYKPVPPTVSPDDYENLLTAHVMHKASLANSARTATEDKTGCDDIGNNSVKKRLKTHNTKRAKYSSVLAKDDGNKEKNGVAVSKLQRSHKTPSDISIDRTPSRIRSNQSNDFPMKPTNPLTYENTKKRKYIGLDSQIKKNRIVENSSDMRHSLKTKRKSPIIPGRSMQQDSSRVHNTRKTHPSYSKIRVKSQEALGLNLGDVLGDKINDKAPIVNKSRPNIISKTETSTNKRNTPDPCRLCGAIGADYLDLFGKFAGEIHLARKIQNHLNFKVFENDGLSQCVCTECSKTVVNWSQFYGHCAQVHKIIKPVKTKIDVKETSPPSKTIRTNQLDVPVLAESIKREPEPVAEGVDDIEKMLREMHGMDSGDSDHEANITISETQKEVENTEIGITDSNEKCGESEDEMDMDVEFLEEERDLVDEALAHQKMFKKSVQPIDGVIKSENPNGRKVIRMDRKLSEEELRSLLERTGFNKLSTVAIMKVNAKQSFLVSDIDKCYKEFKEKLERVKLAHKNRDTYADPEYFEALAKSYAHLHLDNVQTSTEMFYRCPECRIYLAASQMPRHSQVEHQKQVALCDFCTLLLPYDTEARKLLVKAHVKLHEDEHQNTSPEIVVNICKLMESYVRGAIGEYHSNLNSNNIDDVNELHIKEEDVNTETEKKLEHKSKYRCNQCNGRFATVAQVRDHLKLHAPENVHCGVCQKTFTSRHALITHEQSHDMFGDKQQCMCDVCGSIFTDEQVYELHMQTHNSVKPTEFGCPHCSDMLPTSDALVEHTKLHPTTTYFCEICELGFSSQHGLRSHKRGTHIANLHICPFCSFSTLSSNRLRSHMRTHHVPVAFPCDQCSQAFHTAKRLRDHIQEEHSKIPRNFACPLCDWCFNHDVNLRKHFEFHIDKGHINCKVCQKPFELEGDKLEIADVVAHKETHTAEENFVYQRPYSPSVSRMTPWREAVLPHSGARMFCRDCGVACSTPLELRKHQKTHKPFYCNVCQTVSNNQQTFELHMKQHACRKHGCKSCGKRFMTRTALNLHNRTHANSPKFVCAVCARKFRIVTDWRRHERSCRELNGWPRMDLGTPQQRETSTRRARRHRKLVPTQYTVMLNGDDDSSKFVEYLDGDDITYEYIDAPAATQDSYNQDVTQEVVQIKEESQTYADIVLHDEEGVSDDTIEIDESELVAFREWQRASQKPDNVLPVKHKMSKQIIKSKGTRSNSISGPVLENNPVYYSIAHVPGKEKQLHLLPSAEYMIDNEFQTEDTEYATELTDDAEDKQYIIQTHSGNGNIMVSDDGQHIIPGFVESSNSIVLNSTNDSNVLHVLDGTSTIVYNMNMPNMEVGNFEGQDIVFQEDDCNDDNSGNHVHTVSGEQMLETAEPVS